MVVFCDDGLMVNLPLDGVWAIELDERRDGAFVVLRFGDANITLRWGDMANCRAFFDGLVLMLGAADPTVKNQLPF